MQIQKSRHRILPSLTKIKSPSKKSQFSDQIANILLQTFKIIPVGMTPMQQLELKWNNNEDLNEIKYILQDILQFPCSDLADIHRDSNRLGSFDIFQNHDQLSRMIMQEGEPEIYCQCCGFLLQRGQIPIETSLKSLINIGVSTILYFQTLINLALMLTVLFFIYGIFSLVTNIVAYHEFSIRDEVIPNPSFLILSLSSKQLDKTQENMNFYLIQCWLGLATVVVWFFMFLRIKFVERNDQIIINSKTISASDFSVVIEGVPTTLKKQDLQKQLDDYYQQLKEEQKPKQIDRPFKISKYNVAVPFYLTIDQFMGNQLKKLIEEKNDLRKQFINWIHQRKKLLQFSVSKTERYEAYQKYSSIEKEIEKKYQNIVKRIVNEMNKNYHQNPTTSVYLTFESSYAKELFCRLNTPEDALEKTKKRFWCCQSQYYFDIKFQEQVFMTNVKRAPQPEDIIWTNIGQTLKEMTLRKILTYSVTVVILGASFVIFYFLSKEQVKNDADVVLSFVISVSITLFNIIIQVVIRLLTKIQRQITQTNFQTGLALKSIVAQLINSIVLTFVIKKDIQQNIYKVDGLAYVVFTMGITNSFITPLLKVFDVSIVIEKIKGWYYRKASSKLGLSQSQLNSIFTYQQFQVGYEYIYPVNLFLFICFFVSLQPIICIFGILGLILMYWIQKYLLFNRCKRPFPGTDTINRALYRIIYFAPLIFSLGNLTWSNLLQSGGPSSALIPNLISVGLSSIFVLVPNKLFFSKFLSETYEKELIYEDQRIYLPSEYDRLNPSTSKSSMAEYYNFLKQYKMKMKHESQDKKLLIQQIILNQKQRGEIAQPDVARLFSTFDLNTISRVSQNIIKENNEKLQSAVEQVSEDEQVSAEENHIIIKEHTIEQLRVEKKSKKKKLVNSQTLFKDLFFDQKNVFQFVQNWVQKGEKVQDKQMNFLDLFIINNKKEKEEEKDSCVGLGEREHKTNENNQNLNNFDIDGLIRKQKQITYDVIKKVFLEQKKISNQQVRSKQNNLVEHQSQTRHGLMNFVLNNGQIHPSQSNQLT